MLFKNKIFLLIKNKSRFGLILLAILAVPLFSGCGEKAAPGYKINLEIWGVVDNSEAYAEVIKQYKQINPYIGEIKYRKFTQQTYSQELIDALASGQGPDIFLIENTWLPSYLNKVEPAPATLMNPQDMEKNFPDAVGADFVDGGMVYAAPVSVDSMQLYYNKDLFNAAGITSPPKNWQEFNELVKKLTIIDSKGNILQSGAAIGTGKNISRSSDLLSLLMFQNGVKMPTEKKMDAKFEEGIMGADRKVVLAGEQALGYYTQFAKLSTASNVANDLYTWNTRQSNSLDVFAEGRVAMMFNYSWQHSEIKRKNAKLNYAVAPVPQINPTNPMTVASYSGYAVARNKLAPKAVAGVKPVPNAARVHEAWQFIRFLTLKNNGKITLYNAITKNPKEFPINFDPAAAFLTYTKQPAARRDLIEEQKTNPILGVFAEGNLIAKRWYQFDPRGVESIFVEIIESVVRGDKSLREALILAKNRVNYAGK